MISKPSLIVVSWDGIQDPLQYIYKDSRLEANHFDLLLFDYSGIDHANNIDKKYLYLSSKTECKGQIIYLVYQFILSNSLKDKYQYIALFDDDQYISYSDIQKLLFIGQLEALDVFQPSLTHDSFYDNRQFLHKEGYHILKSPWVEVMCPFYRMDIFLEFAPHCIDNISGTGVDIYLVPTIQFLLGKNNTAVVHAVQLKHARPIRTGKRVFSNNKTSVQEIQEMQLYCKSLLNKSTIKDPRDFYYKQLIQILKDKRNGKISLFDKLKRIPKLLKNLYQFLVDLSYR
jgi:hypothetical protein